MNDGMGADAWRQPVSDWPERPALWSGPALVDLHDGKGTSWIKIPDGRYYPDCPCHKPVERLRAEGLA